MRRLLPAVPALLALVAAGPAVAGWSSTPMRSAADPPVIRALTEVPFEGRLAVGVADAAAPTTPEEAIVLAKSLEGRLGGIAQIRSAPGLVVSGSGDADAVDRIGRTLAAMRARILRLLRVDGDGKTSQLVLLASSRDRFELVDATLFGQAPLPSRTAVLGVAEGRLVVAAWRDPDAGSFLAATARALAAAAIVEDDLAGPGTAPAAASPPSEGEGTSEETAADAREAPESTTPPAPSGDERPPAWFLEGLASQLAAATASPNALEPRQRETGLRYLRGGGDPRRIFALPADDPQWIALDGVAQSVAFLAVQRLAEDVPGNLDRLIDALRAGRSWPEAWRSSLGGTPAALAERLVRHHAVND